VDIKHKSFLDQLVKEITKDKAYSAMLEMLGLSGDDLGNTLGKIMDDYSYKNLRQLSSQFSEKILERSTQALYMAQFVASKGEILAQGLTRCINYLASLLSNDRQKAKKEANRFTTEVLCLHSEREFEPEKVITHLSVLSTILRDLSAMAKSQLQEFYAKKPNAPAALVLLPRIKDLKADEFLDLLQKQDVHIDFSDPCDYVAVMCIALFLRRPDIIPQIHIRTAAILEKSAEKPTDADSNTAKLLLDRNWEHLANAGFMDGTFRRSADLLIRTLELMFDLPNCCPQEDFPHPIRREIGNEIYCCLYNAFRNNTPDQFIAHLKRRILEALLSYTWDGFKIYGTDYIAQSKEYLSEYIITAEDLFGGSRLTPDQRKVAELEAILKLREDTWSEQDKARWLNMKSGPYRQHLHIARQKCQRYGYGSQQLLHAIFQVEA